MPALNFQKQFADDVESGLKRQTIRLVRKHPIIKGNTLFLYTGQRTKYCKKLGETVCKSVEQFVIESSCPIRVFVGINELSRGEVQRLAHADGFSTLDDFINFFRLRHGLPFQGVLIKW